MSIELTFLIISAILYTEAGGGLIVVSIGSRGGAMMSAFIFCRVTLTYNLFLSFLINSLMLNSTGTIYSPSEKALSNT